MAETYCRHDTGTSLLSPMRNKKIKQKQDRNFCRSPQGPTAGPGLETGRACTAQPLKAS